MLRSSSVVFGRLSTESLNTTNAEKLLNVTKWAGRMFPLKMDRRCLNKLLNVILDTAFTCFMLCLNTYEKLLLNCGDISGISGISGRSSISHGGCFATLRHHDGGCFATLRFFATFSLHCDRCRGGVRGVRGVGGVRGVRGDRCRGGVRDGLRLRSLGSQAFQ